MSLIKYLLISCFYIVSILELRSQHVQKDSIGKKHRIMLSLGHAHVRRGIDGNGNKQLIVLGSWSIDYDYSLSKKVNIGFHNDVILQNFDVEEFGKENDKILQRSYPIASAFVVSWKFLKHLSITGGAGEEYSNSTFLFLTRAGAEYGVELPKEWELGVSLMYDYKWEAYDTWLFGFGIGKKF